MAYLVNYYSQQDPQWKKKKLGFSNITIGTDGCALTSLAMLVKGFGYDENPASLNKKLRQNGGFIDALVIWGSIPALFPKILYRNIILCRDHSAPLAEIDSSLAKGQPVLVEVDRSLSSGLQNHWVVLYAKKGDDYLMTDPWPHPSDDKETLLTTRYGFGRPAKKIITAVIWYEMKGMVPPPPSDGFYVQVLATASTGLRLRAQPTTASDFLSLAAAGSYLRVLEDENSARQKIGVINQWLHVRDSQGVEGYVAAWYVDSVDGIAPDPTPDPVPEPNPEPEPNPDPTPDPEPDTATLTVYVDPSVGESGLRMRATPNISGDFITTISAKAEVSVLENAEAALAKIGTFNEWIHVKDDAGNKGYVAAWYLLTSLDDIPEPEPEPEPESEPEPSVFSVTVFPSLGRNGLRLRSTPKLSGRLITVLRGGTYLNVLEEATQARKKIGVINQWLHVETLSGAKGYVAAWYVSANDLDTPPDPVPDTVPLPEDLTVYVIPLAASGLRMRSGASTNYPSIKTLMPNAALTVLESPEVAIAKIGAMGEWLHVRDASGEEGYVAAWYVIR